MNVSAASLAPDSSVRKATPSDITERTARSGAVVETIFCQDHGVRSVRPPFFWVGVVSEKMCWKWHPVIFSTCYLLRSTFSARDVLTTFSARTVVTFQHGAIWLVLPTTFSAWSHIWLVLPTTFSARSHLIGTVSARTPLIGGQFCDFQHGAFSLVDINCNAPR